MNNEYAILSYLGKNQETSQRKIAGGTGLSAATVNLMLKKMVRKGLVKLEKVNGTTIRYIVTPSGIARKTKLACSYLKHIYRQITALNNALAEIAAVYLPGEGADRKLVFYGPRDEIYEMLKIAAGNLDIEYQYASTVDELRQANVQGSVIVTWQGHDNFRVPGDAKVVNVLEFL